MLAALCLCLTVSCGARPAYSADAMNAEALYDAILASLQSGDTEIVFHDVDAEDAAAAFDLVLREHPELFWVRSGYTGRTVTVNGRSTLCFEPILSCSGDELTAKRQRLDAELEAILTSVDDGWSDFRKALTIHDLLVETTEYDVETAALPDDEYAFETESGSAYGCLVEHRAVCAGYTAAYQLLMQALGIECGSVSGTAGGISHAWNYVNLDGAYYYVDVTWDDPVHEGGADVLTHEFFCVTTDELLLTHMIDDGETPPDCVETAYDYYRVFGLYLPEYDRDAVFEMISAALDDGSVEIKFGSRSALEEAFDALFGRSEIFRVPGLTDRYGSVSYTDGASGLVLRIYFIER